MRRTLLSILLLLCFFTGLPRAGAQSWKWARASGQCSGGLIEANPTAVDPSGNVYVAGYWDDGCVIFGTDTLTNTLPGAAIDMFLVKYDSLGNYKWSRTPAPGASGYNCSIAADDSGNIYVSGFFYSATTTFGAYTLTRTGSPSGYLVKYDSLGNVLWAKTYGGQAANNYVATAHDGGVYVTGSFYGPYFAAGMFTMVNTGAYTDLFLVKYDALGHVLWARQAGGSYIDQSYSVSCDTTGNIYIAGTFQSPDIAFGPTMVTNADTNRINIFLAKYDQSGAALWGTEIAVADTSSFYFQPTIKADNAGNVYMAGSFSTASITIGSHLFYNDSAGCADIFLAKFDSAGNVIWARHGGGKKNDYGFDLAPDAAGNIWIACGAQSDFVTLDTAYFAIPPNVNADGSFIAEFNSSGHLEYLTALACGGDDYIGIATDHTGNIFVGGDYINGPFYIGDDTLNNMGVENFFVAKLSIVPDIPSLATPYAEAGHKVSVYPNPADDGFTIVTDMPAGNTSSVTIYNGVGQVIKAMPIVRSATRVPAVNMPAGMYICRITVNGEVTLKKITVVH